MILPAFVSVTPEELRLNKVSESLPSSVFICFITAVGEIYSFDDAKVNWQTAELGKVDVGGGGTIAYIMSLYGMEVIDSGVPVLSMHAPWEVTSKADIYEAKKAYVAFLKNA